ncbi:MAG: extensin family protein [Myxococcota bacterium]|nr:extensin family protein [Myxococcota bacterium]
MRRVLPWVLPWVLIAACGGGVEDVIDVSFTSPSPGASFTRDQLGATGALAAIVPFELAISGSPSRIGFTIGTTPLPDVEAAGTIEVRRPGMLTLTATAYDGDEAIISSSVDVTVVDLALTSCKAWLDVYQIDYTVGPTQPGVKDPVTAKLPINGMPYQVVGATTPRTQMYGDCTLIKSLAEAAPHFRERGLAEVTDYGVYNYRCIGSGTPPNCPNGLSQHSFGTAIDLAGFTGTDGTYYSVNDDWVIDPADDTCTAATVEGKDRFLHELICELKTAEIWNIVLTPNYNAAHRNHFHVDLTPDSDFIERRGEPVGH